MMQENLRLRQELQEERQQWERERGRQENQLAAQRDDINANGRVLQLERDRLQQERAQLRQTAQHQEQPAPQHEGEHTQRTHSQQRDRSATGGRNTRKGRKQRRRSRTTSPSGAPPPVAQDRPSSADRRQETTAQRLRRLAAHNPVRENTFLTSTPTPAVNPVNSAACPSAFDPTRPPPMVPPRSLLQIQLQAHANPVLAHFASHIQTRASIRRTNPYGDDPDTPDPAYYTALHHPWNVVPSAGATRISEFRKLEGLAPKFDGKHENYLF